jgi:hypothetical protein
MCDRAGEKPAEPVQNYAVLLGHCVVLVISAPLIISDGGQLGCRWVMNANHKPRWPDSLIAINCKIFVAAMQAAWASFMERCVPDVVSLVLYINHKVDRFPLTTNHLNTEFAPMP